MAHTFADLERMSITELKAKYDQHAGRSELNLNFIREEIARRESEKLAKHVRFMTAVILVLTLVNVGLVAASL